MRAGPLYIILVTIAFLLVASKQTNTNRLIGDLSASRSVTANEYKAFIGQEIDFSLKKIWIEPACFKHLYNRLLENSNGGRTDLTASSISSYLIKRISFKPLIKKPLLLTLYYSAEKEDDHLLS
jgi:hypothetical protein